MRILINCSNLKIGGGLQVAHSFLNSIRDNKTHSFFIVLSSFLRDQINTSEFGANFKFSYYDLNPSFLKIISGKNKFLDSIVKRNKIDVTFSVFGPTYWKPSVHHIVGYAKPHYIYKESPFYKIIPIQNKIKLKIKEKLHLMDFSKNNDILVSENEDVSLRLRKLFKKKEVHTITNFYNQVFDRPERWNKDIILPKFEGFTLLTISANYPHKNLSIIPKVVDYLNHKYPHFNFRFVISIDSYDYRNVNDPNIKKRLLCIGKVNINQCPFLYSQADVVFLPTLLECFTATYPEAMRMEKPILTSNLDFARGLCNEGAIFFNPLDPKDIGEKIYKLSKDAKKAHELVKMGLMQLKKFDSYQDRAGKYLELITT